MPRILVAMAMLGLTLSCKTTGPRQEGTDSDLEFAQSGPLVAHGHESLTEFAVIDANKDIADNWKDEVQSFAPFNKKEEFSKDGMPLFFTEERLDRSGFRNSHPLTWGCLAADVPASTRGILIRDLRDKERARDTSGDTMTRLNYELCKHYGKAGTGTDLDPALRPYLKDCDDMPYAGPTQSVHFLRNFDYSGSQPKLGSAKEACVQAQDRVRAATLEGIRNWNRDFVDEKYSGEVDSKRYPHFLGYFFIGLASHTIQDSFSGAHIERDAKNTRVINKICHYSEKVKEAKLYPEVCMHKVPFDERDIIWEGGYLRKLINSARAGREGLTAEGKGAVNASTGYLLTVAEILKEVWNKYQDSQMALRIPEDKLLKPIVDRHLDLFFNFSGDPVAISADPKQSLRLSGSGFMNCNRIVEKF